MAKTPAKRTAASAPATITAVEAALVTGDLKQLSARERLSLYQEACGSMGLNPVTKPFDYIEIKGKLMFYAGSSATDQLRKINHISIDSIDREGNKNNGLYTVTVHGSCADRTGGRRQDEAVGIVSCNGLGNEDLANAMMRAETKAKRRFTLSICGLSFLDLDTAQANEGPDGVLAASGGLVEGSDADAGAIETELASDEVGAPDEYDKVTQDAVRDDQPDDNATIELKDQKRLFALADEVWADKDKKSRHANLKILIGFHGFKHTKDVTKAKFGEIVDTLRSDNALGDATALEE